jgi:hypothetical protein
MLLYSKNYHNHRIDIHPDEYPVNPRDNANLGTIVTWHGRYSIGDKHNFHTPSEFSPLLTDKDMISLPVYMYDHSAIALSTAPFNCPWDSGKIGWIYTTKDKVRASYGVTRVGSKLLPKVLEHLREEIAEYSRYLNGESYGFIVFSPSGEELDSCWGYPDSDFALKSAQQYIDSVVFP